VNLGQRWSVATLRVNSLDRSGTFITESYGGGGQPFAGPNSSSNTEGQKRWTWHNSNSGGYLAD
jgi:hypothetical protein